MTREFESSELFKYIRNAIFDDGYIFGTIHGPPRSSKSTLGLWAAHSVYEDWGKVLSSTVFNLSSVISRMKQGKPERWPTSNNLHSRVPFLLWDDFCVQGGNKAVSQHQTSWDEFKAAFDVLGTKLGVLMLTMVDASGATQQLQGKYNAEIFVNAKGKYKFDIVHWKQDYHGFRVLMKKEWIENGTFKPIPEAIYREYDELRMDLTDQAFVRLEDALANDTIDALLKIIKENDVQLLRVIDTLGPIRHETAKDELGEDYKATLIRCKARSLVIPTNTGSNNYKIELSSIGRDALTAIDKAGLFPKKPIITLLKTAEKKEKAADIKKRISEQ